MVVLSAFNSGAISGIAFILAVRVEGFDRNLLCNRRKSNGLDNFKFWEETMCFTQPEQPDTSKHIMRLRP
jgi:hypothetical protein